MDANITHGAALLFAGTFPPPDGLRARTASKRRLKSRQGAAFPRRFIRLSSALAQRSAHPSLNSRLALRRLVDLAGSTTIDNEFTDDFKDVNGASLARCGSHLEPQPALEPCAPLAHLDCPPPDLPVLRNSQPPTPLHFCCNRAALSLVVHRGRLSGAVEALLVVPFPQDAAAACTWIPAAPALLRDGRCLLLVVVARTCNLGGCLPLPLLDMMPVAFFDSSMCSG